jgi:hypothetical protein
MRTSRRSAWCSGPSASWSASALRCWARHVEPVGARPRAACTTADGCTARAGDGAVGPVAVLAGWITTEVGRQPWTCLWPAAHGRLGLPLGAPAVAASLLAFIVVYFAVFGAGHLYILKLMGKPPVPGESARSAACPRSAPPASRRRRPRPDALPSHPNKGAPCDRSHLHLGLHHRLCRLRLCGAGRLRSRHRHPVPDLCPGRARHGDELHRAGVGRQRDLAGAGRRRAAGGLSAGLRGDPARALCAHHRHAAGPGVPGRGLRIPLARSRRTAASGTWPSPAARCWPRSRRG